jgi:hypothetical protein
LGVIGVELDLFAACALGDRNLIRSMWRADSPAALGVHRLPLLHFGIVSRDVGVVEMLLDLGAMLDPPGAGLSPLHSAVAIGSARMVRCLAAAGASGAAVDAFGATAFEWAERLEDAGSEILTHSGEFMSRTTSMSNLT